MKSDLFGAEPLVIAEVAQNHDGSLGAAHAYIDAVARAGARAIKFQTHIASAESSADELWRVRFSRQDATRYDYWKRMEFTAEQWLGLAEHASARELMFLSSPFSVEAADILERTGMRAWKIGAGELYNPVLLERVARTGRPVILSSGMASWADLDAAVARVRSNGGEVAVLQCTTEYPCPPEKIGLNLLAEIRERYRCPAGLSDHSGTIYAGLAAAALGADIIEVHVTLSRECFGPDVVASITTSELRQLVEGVGFIATAMRNPVDKNVMAGELQELRNIFGKSVIALRDLPAGSRPTESDLGLRKPGTGIPAARLPDVLHSRMRRPVAAGSFLKEDDLESDR